MPLTGMDVDAILNWALTSEEDRKTALANMALAYAKEHGLDPPPKVEWTELPAPPGLRSLGQYSPGTNTLTPNPKEAGGYGDALDTVHHEMRHAEQ
jgi:hypothetical protein